MTQLLQLEHQLIGDIYDAAISPPLWAQVIAGTAQMAGAEKGNLLAYDRLNPDYFLFHSHGITPEQLQFYQDGGFAALDHEFSGRFMGEYEGRALTNHKHFGCIETFKREAGQLYTDFFAKVGILYQVGGLMEKTDFRWSVIGLHRSEAGGPFPDETAAALSRLLPHFRRALQIHRQLVNVPNERTHLYRTLDNLVTGVILLDAQSKIRYANARAEQLLRDSRSLTVTSGHNLRAADPATNTTIQHMFEATMRTSRRENLSSDVGGVIRLGKTPGSPRLMLTITPLSELSGYRELATDGICTAVFISNPDSGYVLSRNMLKSAYQLTDRECDLCQQFVNQATLEGISESCDLSLATVRTYLKFIYEKTGQHSQAELMRLLMGHRLDFNHTV